MKLILALLGLLGALRVGAQVQTSGEGVSLAAFDSLGRGEYVYSYTVSLDPRLAKKGHLIEAVYLDVSSPKAITAPILTGVRGHFIFDATRTRFEDVSVGHAPLFVGVPDGWFGFVSREGYVGWNPESGRARAGTGLVLRSTALPALRYWTVVPDLPLPDEDKPEIIDPTLVVPFGYTLGPGVNAKDVTAEYVLTQLENGCAARAVDQCALLKGMAGALVRAGASSQRQEIVRLYAAASRVRMHPLARIAILGALRALDIRVGSGH